jgi:hypothetical protein
MKNLLLSAFLALAPAAAAAQAPGLQRIGAAGGVTGLVRATAPGAAEARAIKSGAPLFLNDRVVTDGKARLQVMLLDETVFTVGPNSDVQLDEFVYDPSNDAGKVSVKIAKGAFRFVTGKVARKDPENMKVKLSVGTIGIRGTQFLVNVSPGLNESDVIGDSGIGGQLTTRQTAASVQLPPQTGPVPNSQTLLSNSAEQPSIIRPPDISTIILLGPGSNNDANETEGAITLNNGTSWAEMNRPGYGVTVYAGQTTFEVQDMSQLAASLAAELSPAEAQDEGGGAPRDQQQSAPAAAPGEGPSVSEDAGELTAAGGSILADASGLGELTQSLGDTSSQAVLDILDDTPVTQVTFPDGISTWDNVRSIETGLVNYSASGLCTITGSAAGTYATNFSLLVDFGARQYGGGGSSIELVNLDSTAILPKDFSNLTGNGVIALSTDMSNIDNFSFEGSQITFNNAGGVPAANATVDVNYNNGIMGNGATQLTALPGPAAPQ